MAVSYNDSQLVYLSLLVAFSDAQSELLLEVQNGYQPRELSLKVRYSYVLLEGLNTLINDPNQDEELLNDYVLNITFLLSDYINNGVSLYSFLNNGGSQSGDITINISINAKSFLELTDTPNSYVGQKYKGVRVNGSETGLEFIQEEDRDIPITSNGQTSFSLSPAPQNYTQFELFLNGQKLIYGTHYSLNITGTLTYSYVTLKTTSKLIGRGY